MDKSAHLGTRNRSELDLELIPTRTESYGERRLATRLERANLGLCTCARERPSDQSVFILALTRATHSIAHSLIRSSSVSEQETLYYQSRFLLIELVNLEL